eukprot:NODE_5_length_72347_cov_1.339331.p9 type:complete len:666 gc:universal NODE_5_length_72347_cov_1.339331:66282-64285(-)
MLTFFSYVLRQFPPLTADLKIFSLSQMSVRFCAIRGGIEEEKVKDYQVSYLLEIDRKKILLDVGYIPDDFDCNIDAVLLSHSSLECVKDLPKLSKKGYTGPIYATLPTLYFSRMALLQYFDGNELIKEIENSFQNAINVTYMQPFKVGEVELIAYNSAHSPGGSFYKISYMASDFLYCLNINHKREKALNPSDLFSGGSVSEIFTKPTCLITNIDVFELDSGTSRDREAKFVNSIIHALKKRANVLVPVDATARLFEILYILDNAWCHDYDTKKKNYCKHPIFFLAKNAKKWIQYGKGMLESFSDALSSEFATTRKHPFEFRFFNVIEEIEKLPRGPYVVVTIDKDLEDTFGRELTLKYVASDSAIILTSRPTPGSLSDKLLQIWKAENSDMEQLPLRLVNGELSHEYNVNVPLEGEELQKYYQEEQKLRELEILKQQEAESLKKKKKKPNTDMDVDENLELDDESSITELSEMGDDNEAAVHKQHITDIQLDHFSKTHDLFVYDSDVNRMFPYTEYPIGIPTISSKDSLLGKRKWDEYGLIIDTSKYESKGILPTVIEDDEEEIPQGVDYVPSKVEQREFNSKAKFFFLFVDMQGLSDGPSMLTIFSQLEPKKLILTRGLSKFIEEISTDIANAEVIPSINNEWIEISSAGNVINVIRCLFRPN